MRWFYSDNGQQKGPVDDSALDQLVAMGTVRDDTLVWHEGLNEWQKLSAVRGGGTASGVAAPAAGETAYCSQCGRPFARAELVGIGSSLICANCKPLYLQRLREGGAQAAGAFIYGGFWIRFAARLIDGLLLQAVFLVVRIPLGLGVMGRVDSSASASLILTSLIVSILSLVANACYEIFFIGTRGATIGKMLLGLKVVRPDGSPVSLALATGRYFAQWVSGITLGIGYIMAGFDDQKRSLHDRICETRVIRTR